MNDQISKEEKDELSEVKELLKDRPQFISRVLNDNIIRRREAQKEVAKSKE